MFFIIAILLLLLNLVHLSSLRQFNICFGPEYVIFFLFLILLLLTTFITPPIFFIFYLNIHNFLTLIISDLVNDHPLIFVCHNYHTIIKMINQKPINSTVIDDNFSIASLLQRCMIMARSNPHNQTLSQTVNSLSQQSPTTTTTATNQQIMANLSFSPFFSPVSYSSLMASFMNNNRKFYCIINIINKLTVHIIIIFMCMAA